MPRNNRPDIFCLRLASLASGAVTGVRFHDTAWICLKHSWQAQFCFVGIGIDPQNQCRTFQWTDSTSSCQLVLELPSHASNFFHCGSCSIIHTMPLATRSQVTRQHAGIPRKTSGCQPNMMIDSMNITERPVLNHYANDPSHDRLLW